MTDQMTALQNAIDRARVASSDFDLTPAVTLPAGRKLRPAGVLVPVQIIDGTAQVILTKRSSHLKHHPGQIAFPGGKQDEGDTDVTAAALREAQEEIGLPPDHVRILGQLPCHETVTGFVVTPTVGLIQTPFAMRPEPGEVEEVFCVPLAHVTDRARFSIEGRYWRGQMRRYYTVPFGPYYIWGATARMLFNLAEHLAP
ncbi:CoA pyrophosphatase [Cognatishimia sp. SS12]|uniref:CoA pyrophosphatase n=1 Tax=Cognatishimia sp. SS12 TaxID=2979465 RepID=UPI00232F71DB|nr:CoA pyrophosphatase [Cognatishimia sp. SS12]MDC0737716.1 CoA pyrophosphatase [Cognatishimia sp. SS12]